MKIVVDGEAFDYDTARMPMSDALAIEKEWGRRYAEWEIELQAGSAEACCVLIWLIWRRDGRDKPLADILEGKIDFDYSEVMRSLVEAGRQERAEAEAQAGNPTPGAAPRTAPDGTGTTPESTPGSSPRSSASGRGKSGSSARASSTP